MAWTIAGHPAIVNAWKDNLDTGLATTQATHWARRQKPCLLADRDEPAHPRSLSSGTLSEAGTMAATHPHRGPRRRSPHSMTSYTPPKRCTATPP
jgi:hypothetical protein